VVRYLGVTGHFRPDALVEGSSSPRFDCILMALNAADRITSRSRSNCCAGGGESRWGLSDEDSGARTALSTWTPPSLEAQKHSWEGWCLRPPPGTLTMREAIGSHAGPAGEQRLSWGAIRLRSLRKMCRIARDFTPYNDQQMAALATKAEPVSKPSLFFRFLRSRQCVRQSLGIRDLGLENRGVGAACGHTLSFESALGSQA